MPRSQTRSILGLILVVSGLTAPGCKETEFNHYVNPPPARTYSYSHPLKELRSGGSVDILWVIDNSGSMSTYQRNVAQNTSQFMRAFTGQAGIQWRMGLISSDESDQPYVGFTPSTALDFHTSNPAVTFQNAVNDLGTAGSSTEMFFTPVLNALRAYPMFLRPSSILALIFLTDAGEQSTINATTFMRELAAIKGDIHDVIAYGAFVPSDFGCIPATTEDEWNYAGSAYEEVIQATHGKVYKACDVNFGNSLADLGKDLVQRVVSPRMYLAARPRQGTLVIRFHGQVLPGGPKSAGGFWVYDYELNAVVFHDLAFASGDQESVEVSYREDNGIDIPGLPEASL